MIHESKLMLLSCAVALIIGASLVSPLLILHTSLNPFPENPPIHPNPQSAQSQITVNLKSVQVAAGIITRPAGHNSTEQVTEPSLSGTIKVSTTKYLNNNQNIPDLEVDYFLMQLSTETGTWIMNKTVYIGTAYNRSYTDAQLNIVDNYFLRQTFGNYGGGVGTFFCTWSIGTTQDNTQKFSGSLSANLFAAIAESQTLTMTLSKIGAVTVWGNSTVASTSDAGLVETVTLSRNGNSFVYNNAW